MNDRSNRGYFYIVSNYTRTVFYSGVTSSLTKRIAQHREGRGSVFAARYRCKYLVYYEAYALIRDAIAREKQVKNWHRAWKIALIRSKNPQMRDLSEELI